MNRRLVVIEAAALALGVGGLNATLAQTQSPSTPYVLSGTAAPGAGGANFTLFNTPSMNNAGFAAFAVNLSSGVNDDDGIWAGDRFGLTMVARENSAAPGTGGAVFGDASSFGLPPFANPLVDGSGQVAFFGRIRGAGVTFGVNDNGLWVGAPGSIALAARTGNAAPGVSAASFSFVSDTALIESGRVAFRGALTGPGVNSFNDTGLWTGVAGGVQLAAIEGSQAPGTPAGVGFGGFNSNPALASSGEIVFQTGLTGPVSSADDAGVWAGAPGSLRLIAREGDAAPGTGSGVTFSQLSTLPSINAAGTVAVQASLTGTGVTTGNDAGIWIGSGTSNLQKLVREGESAAGIPGVNYVEISQFVVMNAGGRVGFSSELDGTGVDGTNNVAIFSGTVGNVSKVVRKGDAAPGTPGGVKFAGFDFSVALNNGGQTAFIASLTGTGVGPGNNRGIWAVDPFGELVKIAREGDAISVDPGDDRTVADVGLGMSLNSSGGEGRSSSFNDSSQVVYNVFFTDKTRAIITSRVGGPARIKPTSQPPIFGPAVSHGYHLGTPAQQFEITNINNGDTIGYLKFVGFSTSGVNDIKIYLDFNGTFAAATDELNRGALVSGYGYAVAVSDLPGWDLLLTYAGANDGTDKFFYWNFANLGVDLDRIMVTPEPGSGLIVASALTLLSRRRTRSN